LRDIGASTAVIAAGFLHDVVEDTQVTPEEIEARFGEEVRALVEGVTKLGGIHFTNRTEAQAENLRRMFLAMASDIRVVLVKLADRLHNMRTLSALKPEKQQRIARETRDIYAPLANRLGIGRFKWELEDLAFKVLEPESFRDVQQQVATKRSEREERLGATVQLLRDRLASVGLAECDVSGRPKHLYGIWSKMQRQQKAFHEIYDVAALRILCPSVESCYRALAVVHDTFRPIPGRFKDYIGLPKPNGYQSLHTAVIGRHRPIEVQIRTAEMHRVAELCQQHHAYFHSDTVQTMGHYRFNLSELPVDFLAGAAHKFNGPKGVGFAFIRKGRKISPLITGGAQERELRGGTENIYGIIGLAKALEISYRDIDAKSAKISALKSLMMEKLKAEIPGVEFNGDAEGESLYTVLSVSFPPNPVGPMLLFNLDLAGISASGGSACSSGSTAGSHVIQCLRPGTDRTTVRFSFGKFNTKEDILSTVIKLKEWYA